MSVAADVWTLARVHCRAISVDWLQRLSVGYIVLFYVYLTISERAHWSSVRFVYNWTATITLHFNCIYVLQKTSGIQMSQVEIDGVSLVAALHWLIISSSLIGFVCIMTALKAQCVTSYKTDLKGSAIKNSWAIKCLESNETCPTQCQTDPRNSAVLICYPTCNLPATCQQPSKI